LEGECDFLVRGNGKPPSVMMVEAHIEGVVEAAIAGERLVVIRSERFAVIAEELWFWRRGWRVGEG
jgi:hypothetical protein